MHEGRNTRVGVWDIIALAKQEQVSINQTELGIFKSFNKPLKQLNHRADRKIQEAAAHI